MEHKISNELPPIPGEAMPLPTSVGAELSQVERVSEQQSAQAVESGATSRPDPFAASPQQTQLAPQVNPVAALPQQGMPLVPGLPLIADDTDLIEKEWVEKAKEIVARTKHDPYQQNKEVERMKADYMKKRYNKDVKVTED